MKNKTKVAFLATLWGITQSFSAFAQPALKQTPVIPEELRILKDQYSSVVISFYMEKCVNNLFTAFLQNGLRPDFARISSFQVCGCGMDTMRSDMPEKDYLDMLYYRNKMASALIESNLKICGEMYGEYYTKMKNPDPTL